jgi:uncharacterized membrane protein (UPF0182 family)
MNGRFGRVLLPGFLLLVGLPLLADLYIDRRWFESVGYAEVFRIRLLTRVALGVAAFCLTAAAFQATVRVALRISQRHTSLYLHDADGVPRLDLGKAAARIAPALAWFAAVFTGLSLSRHADTFLAFTHASSFGVRDPIFGRDVGFYMFQLPFYDALSQLALWLGVASLLGAAVLYVLRGAIAVGHDHTRIHPPARVHLSVLLAFVLVVLALRAYLAMFDVLYSNLGPMTGASYADVHAKLPVLRIQVAVAAAGALLVLWSSRRTDFTLPVTAGLLYLGAQLAAQFYPDMVHSFSVRPNELERETPYLKFNIEATRAAYGLNGVVERDLSPRFTLGTKDIEQNRDTVDNIRLWDHQQLLDTFAQIQEIRTYYDFHAVDNDRYLLGGKLRQTMLSARELNTTALPNPTWINTRFTFTHGYGLTLGPVNETTPEGLPVLFVQDIPPRSTTPELEIKRPAIYFGELSSDHVFVRTRNREFDRPSGEGYTETDYDGKDGIRFDSVVMRALLALKLGSVDLLLSDDIDARSRVLLYRNIRARLRRVAPYLAFDSDPYMVVRNDGTLVWICDGYTVGDRYPYAQRWHDGQLNYVRNSVKAVVDAYDGTIDLYVSDERDPVLRTWRSVFAHSFKPLRDMPADLRAHVRYPEWIFDIQTQMFATYHMQQAELLYNREDQWEVPALGTTDQKTKMQPYYTMMKLPGEAHAEFIQMLPFTPKRKDNLAAWMVARSDGANLGQLVVYRFPKDRLVYGPQQVINRINQDAEISRQISLWDQRGSQAVFGTLLVIPIEESLIYVRPLYLISEGGKIPELKRVIVVHEKRIAMKPTLREAIDAVFPAAAAADAAAAQNAAPPAAASPAQASGAASAEAPAAVAARPAAARALSHFESALEAQRAGDWARYGEELKAVERLLRELAPEVAQPASAATP